jgi:hypothetical protein
LDLAVESRLQDRSSEIRTPTHEEALQAAADSYVTEAVSKSVKPANEYQAYRKRLFEAGPRTEPDPTPVPVNKAHAKLQRLAKRAAAKDPSLSTEQHYALLAEENPALLAKAVRFTVEEVDDEDEDDDLDDDELDYPELDPTAAPANDPGAGMPRPTAAEARTNQGRSEAPYNDQGDNLRQNPRPAVMAAPGRSYDPSARPAAVRRPPPAYVESTAKAAFDDAVAKRCMQYMAKRPGASRDEALAWATRGKRVRRAYNAWLNAS